MTTSQPPPSPQDGHDAPGPPPYTLPPMQDDTARNMATQGGAVLMLGVPPGAVVGVDHQAFATGAMFKGVKMLPPGPHFLSCAATSLESPGGLAPPTGFFLTLAQRQVVVKVWDAETEMLRDMDDADEAARYADGVRRFEFDAHLAPYDLASHRAWASLSSHVTEGVIAALSPVGGCISIMAEGEDPGLLHPKTAAEAALVKSLAEGKARLAERLQRMGLATATPGEEGSVAAAEGAGSGTGKVPSEGPVSGGAARTADGAGSSGRCFYTRLPRLIKAKGMSPAQLTAANMDKSAQLLGVARDRHGGALEPLLGELQFAFIAFVYGQSLDGFSQWKSLLTALLSCQHAVLHSHQAVFAALMRALRSQLDASLGPDPKDTGGAGRGGGGGAGAAGAGGGGGPQEAPFGVPMVEELLPDSFLRRCFGSFFQMLQENSSEVSGELATEVAGAKAVLRSRLGWEYDMRMLYADDDDDDDGDDDDLPVIVDTSEPYAM
ncbi:hypothetical protein FOA52_014835 [Chlamydomonas sp. UWO 241]|nr:hypothetical protein FOA52_014835 [Chlamydomonas sp. UWO 241]